MSLLRSESQSNEELCLNSERHSESQRPELPYNEFMRFRRMPPQDSLPSMSKLLRSFPTGVFAILLSSCATNGVFVANVQHQAAFDVVDADLSGLSLGTVHGSSPGSSTQLFSQIDSRSDDSVGLDILDVSVGGIFYGRQLGRLRPGLQLSMGLGNASLDGLMNSNTLVSISAGMRLEFAVSSRIALFGLLGVRSFIDTTAPTTCNDGTTSTSVGPGTCSHHGGIAHYNDYIGDSFEPEFGVGLIYRWTKAK